jgi:hypothetical protein
MKKNIPFILIISLLLSLTSCSLAELGYKYGDWLIKRKILEVVKFYSPQQERLEAILDDYMMWHKENMLKQYQGELDLNIEIFKERPHSIKAKDVEGFLLRTRRLYWDSFLPLAYKVVPLLSELGEEQVERTRTLINRKLDEKKDLLKMEKEDKSAYSEEIKNTWKDNLEDWFGELSNEQSALLESSMPGLLTSPKLRFARGVERMKTFLAIFEDLPLPKNSNKETRQNVVEKRSAKLKKFFKSWAEEEFYTKWRKNVSAFMEKFFKSLNNDQKKKFLKKLTSWKDTLNELAKN